VNNCAGGGGRRGAAAAEAEAEAGEEEEDPAEHTKRSLIGEKTERSVRSEDRETFFWLLG
jgi:hypothetical protein